MIDLIRCTDKFAVPGDPREMSPVSTLQMQQSYMTHIILPYVVPTFAFNVWSMERGESNIGCAATKVVVGNSARRTSSQPHHRPRKQAQGCALTITSPLNGAGHMHRQPPVNDSQIVQ